MSREKKLKTEDSRMTLAEYLMFANLTSVDMDKAIRLRQIVVGVSGEKLGY